MKHILIVAPHPDDETLGCGGLIALSVSAGHRVMVLVLTKGEKLFSAKLGIVDNPAPRKVCEMRREESRKAVGILGMDPAGLVFWDFPDAELEQQRATVINKLAAFLAENRPDEIYSTNEYEEHPDHRAAASIVADACTRVKLDIAVRHYFIALPADLSISAVIKNKPVIKVDASAFLPLKKRAVDVFDCHLKIISPQQNAPILASFDDYLHKEEVFINCGRL
jgi:LmbE family N-acetylglucosaminyl deacetylase